jgi:hypothetical protein
MHANIWELDLAFHACIRNFLARWKSGMTTCVIALLEIQLVQCKNLEAHVCPGIRRFRIPNREYPLVQPERAVDQVAGWGAPSRRFHDNESSS